MRAKKRVRGGLFVALLAALLSPVVSAQGEETIDVAIVLDTSSSMESLIDGARLKLWDIVNDLTLLEPTPKLRIALLTYGGNNNDPARGWVRIEAPLTSDLDLVSERLFALECCAGGYEFVARAVKTALDELDWEKDSVRLIFVAGNEPADQDKMLDHRSVGIEAYNENTVLHAIFCGYDGDDWSRTWKEMADVARGHFASIDQRDISLAKTPFDKELAELGAALTRTALPLGEAGAKGNDVQLNQDRKVEALGAAAAATRAQTKASSLYAHDWDLLDAVASGSVDLYEMDPQELPEAMRGMTLREREEYVEDLLVERERIRQRILELGEKRRAHVAQSAEREGLDDSRTFDGVVRRAIREQAERRGLRPAGGN